MPLILCHLQSDGISERLIPHSSSISRTFFLVLLDFYFSPYLVKLIERPSISRGCTKEEPNSYFQVLPYLVCRPAHSCISIVAALLAIIPLALFIYSCTHVSHSQLLLAFQNWRQNRDLTIQMLFIVRSGGDRSE